MIVIAVFLLILGKMTINVPKLMIRFHSYTINSIQLPETRPICPHWFQTVARINSPLPVRFLFQLPPSLTLFLSVPLLPLLTSFLGFVLLSCSLLLSGRARRFLDKVDAGCLLRRPRLWKGNYAKLKQIKPSIFTGEIFMQRFDCEVWEGLLSICCIKHRLHHVQAMNFEPEAPHPKFVAPKLNFGNHPLLEPATVSPQL